MRGRMRLGEGTEAGATALSGEGPRVSFRKGLSF